MKTNFKYLLFSLAIVSLISANAAAAPATADYAQMRTNLYIIDPDGTHVLMDGTLTQYDIIYSNEVDAGDARKLSNSSVNFGMIRNSTVLIIEKRLSMQETDTIFFKMWGMGQYNYQLDLIGYNLYSPGMIGVLEDKYLGTKTPLELNDSTKFTFSVNADAASKAQDRFRIIFSMQKFSLMPLTFTYMKAFPLDKMVAVNWKTEAGTNIRKYVIERSGGDMNFKAVSEILASPSPGNKYSWIDELPMAGENFYRIRSVHENNKSTTGNVTRVAISEILPAVTLNYSPANGAMRVHIEDARPGLYKAALYSASGQVINTSRISHTGGISDHTINNLSRFAGGVYILEVVTPEGKRKIQQFAR